MGSTTVSGARNPSICSVSLPGQTPGKERAPECGCERISGSGTFLGQVLKNCPSAPILLLLQVSQHRWSLGSFPKPEMEAGTYLRGGGRKPV